MVGRGPRRHLRLRRETTEGESVRRARTPVVGCRHPGGDLVAWKAPARPRRAATGDDPFGFGSVQSHLHGRPLPGAMRCAGGFCSGVQSVGNGPGYERLRSTHGPATRFYQSTRWAGRGRTLGRRSVIFAPPFAAVYGPESLMDSEANRSLPNDNDTCFRGHADIAFGASSRDFVQSDKGSPLGVVSSRVVGRIPPVPWGVSQTRGGDRFRPHRPSKSFVRGFPGNRRVTCSHPPPGPGMARCSSVACSRAASDRMNLRSHRGRSCLSISRAEGRCCRNLRKRRHTFTA